MDLQSPISHTESTLNANAVEFQPDRKWSEIDCSLHVYNIVRFAASCLQLQALAIHARDAEQANSIDSSVPTQPKQEHKVDESKEEAKSDSDTDGDEAKIDAEIEVTHSRTKIDIDVDTSAHANLTDQFEDVIEVKAPIEFTSRAYDDGTIYTFDAGYEHTHCDTYFGIEFKSGEDPRHCVVKSRWSTMTRKLVTKDSRLININSRCITNLHFGDTLRLVKRCALLTERDGKRTKLTFVDYSQQTAPESEDTQQSIEEAPLKTKDSSKLKDSQPPQQSTNLDVDDGQQDAFEIEDSLQSIEDPLETEDTSQSPTQTAQPPPLHQNTEPIDIEFDPTIFDNENVSAFVAENCV